MELTIDNITKALATVIEPELHKDLISLNMVKDIEIKDGKVSFTVILTTPACPLKSEIENECKRGINEYFGREIETEVSFGSKVKADGRIAEKLNLPIKNIIAVGSGKGGVGKSTISANLAVALAQTGASVGLLDADLYGPNLPMIMGLEKLPAIRNETLIPGVIHGVSMISLGFLVPDGEAVIWRGPMLHSALQNLLTQTDWGELDYLIVDLPPGTGDIQLSLAQSVPLSGGIIVSSPQAVALSDATRGLSAFRKLEVPVLGIIENMAGPVFGSGGAEKAADELEVRFLGRIHLDPQIREGGDAGKPVVINSPDSEAATEIKRIAGEIAAQISMMREK